MIRLFLASVLFFAHAKGSKPCDFSSEALLRDQRALLKATEGNPSDEEWFRKVSHPLFCMLQAQKHTQGLGKYFSGAFLQPLFGEPLIKGLPKDPRFHKVAGIIERLTLKSSDILKDSIASEFAKGEWTFYADWGKDSFIFIPEETHIQKQAPLIAAASMMHLQKAYLAVDGKEKQEIAQKIKNLYRDIPHSAALQRRVIDQIYRELFEPRTRLRLS